MKRYHTKIECSHIKPDTKIFWPGFWAQVTVSGRYPQFRGVMVEVGPFRRVTPHRFQSAQSRPLQPAHINGLTRCDDKDVF